MIDPEFDPKKKQDKTLNTDYTDDWTDEDYDTFYEIHSAGRLNNYSPNQIMSEFTRRTGKMINTGNYNMLTGVDSFPVKRFKGRGNRRFKVKKDDNDDEVI